MAKQIKLKAKKQTFSNVKIEKLVFQGYGLAHSGGETIFVLNVVPGDVVDVVTIHKKAGILIAKPVKWHENSDNRIPVECEQFGKCGGCDWLPLPYSYQIKSKREILSEIFEKIANDIDVQFIHSQNKYYYRNKVFYPIQKIDSEIKIGMYETRSHNVIENEFCFLQPQSYNEIVNEFKQFLIESKANIYNEKTLKGNIRFLGIRYSKKEDKYLLIIVTKTKRFSFSNLMINRMVEKFPKIKGIIQNINSKSGNKILGDEEKILFGDDYLIEEINGKIFRFNYKSFFQINMDITQKIFNKISQNIITNDNVIDAYCGVGAIGISAVKENKLLGIEVNKSSIVDAEYNAKVNKLSNFEFISANVEDVLKANKDYKDFNTIIFDPPRKGIDKNILNALNDSHIKKIIYLSCNPATQKRDVTILKSYGFAIKEIIGFDMFPQTWHIESLVILHR